MSKTSTRLRARSSDATCMKSGKDTRCPGSETAAGSKARQPPSHSLARRRAPGHPTPLSYLAGLSHRQACLFPGGPAQTAADLELTAIMWSQFVDGAAALFADMAL